MFIIILISALLHAKSETASTLNEYSYACGACCSNGQETQEILGDIRENMDKLFENLKAMTEARLCPKPLGSDYEVLNKFGHRWRRFWWWSGQETWPENVTDVLGQPFGDCSGDSAYCFGRLPRNLEEDQTSLLAIDGNGNIYRWDFDHLIPTAHAAWRAFRDHRMTMYNEVRNSQRAWNPEVLEGKRGKDGVAQDSFMYREQFGVKSMLLDDDNCDCLSTLSMGSGMCSADHSTKYGDAHVFGVDTLDDPHCQGPKPTNMLELYFNEN